MKVPPLILYKLFGMILYNVTVAVDKAVEDEWKLWMKSVHMPEVLGTGFFVEAKLFRVMYADDPESSSYSCQYFAKSLSDFEAYMKKDAPALQQKHLAKFPNRVAAFRTLLESVD